MAGLAAVIVMLGWAVPAGAATNLYPQGSNGYDVSYPNCTATPPTSATFAIVGIGDGRPFKTNGCFGTEWATATKLAGTPGPAAYFNTGYSGAYGRDITPSCTAYAGPSLTTVPRHDQSTYTKAWEIGCSEAAYAAAAFPATAPAPSMWWADIETGNSWSTNRTVNGYAVDGISYEITTVLKTTAGVYSYTAAWTKLVGTGFTATPPFAGDWGPGLTCGSTGFSGAPVWVAQGGTSGGVDTDTGCG